MRTEELARTSRLVSRLTGYHVQYNKAVVGRNAFAHEAGIHQHGVLADRETYEIIDASTVGQEAAQIVLGKHSGRHAFADTLEKMGIHVQGDALNAAFVRFKELADKKVEITEADLEAIVAEELGTGMVHRFAIARARAARRHRRRRRPRASCSTDADGKIEATGTGDGMIDAAIAAIVRGDAACSGKLGNFQVSSVTGGSDALGAVVDHRRRRGPQGDRPRRRDRRRRGVGARVPQRGEQDRAAARARRRAARPRPIGP